MSKRPVRERLIETASRLFYEKGYNLTGINEILRESGVAKASMYQHFRSKEEICVEYLKYMDVGMMKALSGYLEKRREGYEKIMGIIDFVADFFETEGFRGCWCLNTISEIPRDNVLIMKEIRAQKTRFRQFIQQLLEQQLKLKAPEPMANRLYLLFEAALMESQVYMAPWPIQEAQKMFELLLIEHQ